MKASNDHFICNLKSIRKSRRITQGELAAQVGVKRQAIYDMESGKYVPNTALALRLAKELGCNVEDLFIIREPARAVKLVERPAARGPRVSVAKVRDCYVAYPLDGRGMLRECIQAADGLVREDGSVRLFQRDGELEKKALLLGCDPAFEILSAHVSRRACEAGIQCRFASSRKALEELKAGHAHIAATHLSDSDSPDANAELAREVLGDSRNMVVAFSFFEEGLMVAPGNPFGIRTVSDLPGGRIRFVNREEGAALRTLLDECLHREGIPADSIEGYYRLVFDHCEGARTILFNLADAALGLRAVAAAYGLDFVPLKRVRCDLVIPYDLLDHPAIKIILDVLQTDNLRDELDLLPGYESSCTGTVLPEI
jgi:putative molybdopterin biosynthesis protein